MPGWHHLILLLGAASLPTWWACAQPAINKPAVTTQERYSGPVAGKAPEPRGEANFAAAAPASAPTVHYQELHLPPGLTAAPAPVADARLAAIPFRAQGGHIVYELRAGKLTTVINGERQDRKEGEFWVTKPGDKISLETKDDSVVVQTIHIPAQ
jgi:hypothetical protein